MIISLTFSSCKKLAEQNIPLVGDCNSVQFEKSFRKFTDSILDKEVPVAGIHLIQVRDTVNCICHVKYDGDDSVLIRNVFLNSGWMRLQELDTIQLDSVSTDTIGEIDELDTFVEPQVNEEPSYDPEVFEEDTIFSSSDSLSSDSTF